MAAQQYAAETELLPCPFCGGTEFTLDNLVDEDDFGVECRCGIQQISNHTRWEAVRLWNTRAAKPADL